MYVGPRLNFFCTIPLLRSCFWTCQLCQFLHNRKSTAHEHVPFLFVALVFKLKGKQNQQIAISYFCVEMHPGLKRFKYFSMDLLGLWDFFQGSLAYRHVVHCTKSLGQFVIAFEMHFTEGDKCMQSVSCETKYRNPLWRLLLHNGSVSLKLNTFLIILPFL